MHVYVCMHCIRDRQEVLQRLPGASAETLLLTSPEAPLDSVCADAKGCMDPNERACARALTADTWRDASRLRRTLPWGMFLKPSHMHRSPLPPPSPAPSSAHAPLSTGPGNAGLLPPPVRPSSSRRPNCKGRMALPSAASTSCSVRGPPHLVPSACAFDRNPMIELAISR